MITSGNLGLLGEVVLHAHTRHSNFGVEEAPFTPEEVVNKFINHLPRVLAVVFTNHSSNPANPKLVWRGTDLEDRLIAQAAEIRRLDEGLAPIRCIPGIECSIRTHGYPDLMLQTRKVFDLVIASRHGMTELEGNPDEIWRAMVRAAKFSEFDIFGHANRLTQRTEEEWKEFFILLRVANIAAEINLNCLWHDAGIGIEKWLGLMMQSGVPFVIGWDFHRDEQQLFERAGLNLELLQSAGVRLTEAITYREERFFEWINTPRIRRGELWRSWRK